MCLYVKLLYERFSYGYARQMKIRQISFWSTMDGLLIFNDVLAWVGSAITKLPEFET